MGKPNTKCDTCGKRYYAPPGRLARFKHHFCSMTCYAGFEFTAQIAAVCGYCKKPILRKPCTVQGKQLLYCSRRCRFAAHAPIKTNCGFCGREIIRIPHAIATKTGRNYCSHKCRGLSLRRRVFVKCSACGKDIERTVVQAARHKRHFCNKGCFSSLTDQNARQTRTYTEWRTTVFRRDKYTCRECGRKGGELLAHHIKVWTEFPELRFVVSNGLTQCVPCHFGKHNLRKEGERCLNGTW